MNIRITDLGGDAQRITQATTTIGHLRILATTDLHMQMLGHDYVTDGPGAHNGLASLARLINAARQEALRRGRGCILLDNGDTLQGNALGDFLTQMPVGNDHPLVASLNHLRYDALGLGNHDLDHGLPYLQQIAHHLTMPMISTNLKVPGMDALRDAAFIECALPSLDADVPHHTLRIGVLSLLPTQTAVWNRAALAGHGQIACPIDTLRERVPRLRAQGADLVILLAHMGIGEAGESTSDDAATLAQIPGIDAIITGHTHRRFPGRDHDSTAEVDSHAGTLANRPAIMPGFGASDLAVLDLTLARDTDPVNARWRVTNHGSTLLRNSARLEPDPAIIHASHTRHNATRAHLSQPVAHCQNTLHNYFSLAMPTSIARLTARAQARVLRDAVTGTHDADLPILAAVAAHTAGGRGGPDHYLHVPKGLMLRRHLTGFCPYANEIWGLRVTGADIRQQLEYSARAFTHLRADTPEQPLIKPDVPAFHFDTIYGVTYRIDPSQPVGARITDLCWQGVPLLPNQPFLLASNQFRAAGGGGFAAVQDHNIALRSNVRMEDALTSALNAPSDRVWPDSAPVWQFQTALDKQAILETSPAALSCLDNLAHLSPKPCGTTPTGFARLRLHF